MDNVLSIRPILQALPAMRKIATMLFSAFSFGMVLGLMQLPAYAVEDTMQLALHLKVVKKVSDKQQASHEYDKALSYLQQGRVAESLDLLKTTLNTLPQYDDARLTLVTLLIENQKHDEAVLALKEGLEVSQSPALYAETLGRLQLNAGLINVARETLEQYEVHGSHGSYQALLANVLQQLSEHHLASQHFENAIKTGANLPQYWIGWAISLQALGQHEKAKQAYLAVKHTQLSPALTDFVEQRIKQLH